MLSNRFLPSEHHFESTRIVREIVAEMEQQTKGPKQLIFYEPGTENAETVLLHIFHVKKDIYCFRKSTCFDHYKRDLGYMHMLAAENSLHMFIDDYGLNNRDFENLRVYVSNMDWL